MKYEITTVSLNGFGKTLYQIRALKDFGDVKSGDLGGWIKSEKNLSQESNAWVSGNAKVFGGAEVSGDANISCNARVSSNARISGSARVSGNAWVSGNARISGDANISGSARVSGNVRVSGSARVSGNAIIKNSKFPQMKRSDGYDFISVPCSDGKIRVIAGCRYFTFKEAKKHWKETRSGTPLGDETMFILKCLKKYVKMVDNH